jgi:hypothetical protein
VLKDLLPANLPSLSRSVRTERPRFDFFDCDLFFIAMILHPFLIKSISNQYEKIIPKWIVLRADTNEFIVLT